LTLKQLEHQHLINKAVLGSVISFGRYHHHRSIQNGFAELIDGETYIYSFLVTVILWVFFELLTFLVLSSPSREGLLETGIDYIN